MRILFRDGQDEVVYFAVDSAECRSIGPERWIADTGCGDDLICHCDMTTHDWEGVEPAPKGLCLDSANGPVCASATIAYQCTSTGDVIESLIMKDSPPVHSIGRKGHQEGWGFYWEPYKVSYVSLPSGKRVSSFAEGNPASDRTCGLLSTSSHQTSSS